MLAPERTDILGNIPALVWRGQGEGRRPAIISLHGGGGSKSDVDPIAVRYLVAHGLTLVTIDAYHHGDRTPAGFDMSRARDDLGMFLDIIERTARDLFAVAASLQNDPGIDGEHIGLRGGSMGGYVVLMAVGLGLAAAAILSICGGANYERIWELRGAGRNRQGAEDVLKRAREVDPIYHPLAFPPRPVLMIHGEKDPIVPIAGQRSLYNALAPLYAANPGDCLFLTHAGEHATPPEIERMGWEWLTRMLLERP